MIVDRLVFATELSTGRRVLDIGGQKMANCDPNSPFAIKYAEIEKAAGEYKIVDYQNQPTVDYIVDFNKPDSLPLIRNIINEYKPEIILCMEVLEHINYHYELMNAMALAIEQYKSKVFITIPNNGNWVFNALGWNTDHSIAFLKDIACRFIARSDLGKFNVQQIPCMQKYLWYWKIVYCLSFFQPFSLGFFIANNDSTSQT